MKKDRGATMSHDYKPNGATTLFAALDVATGTVIGSCLPKPAWYRLSRMKPPRGRAGRPIDL